MDYKYIEQLLERYWECQTTLEEETILRNFFRQEDVPARLVPYRQFFKEQDEMAREHLSKDFADKMLQMVGEDTSHNGGRQEGNFCKARRLTFVRRLRPFYRAAGLIAILLTIGNAAHQSFSEDEDIADSQQMAESIAADSLQQITIGQPEQQSVELAKQPIDTINTLPR